MEKDLPRFGLKACHLKKKIGLQIKLKEIKDDYEKEGNV